MSQDEPRPGQATFAAWLIIGGSVILVVTAWQRISNLHTLEVQEELRRVLSEPPISGTGLTVDSLQTTIRVLSMVAAGAATAAAILGVQALRRSTSARLALTVLAPLVLVGGFATAGFFAPMVVAGITMLWLRPTRDWFAGRPWLSQLEARRNAGRKAPELQRTDPSAAPPAPQPTASATPEPGEVPAPYVGRYAAAHPLPRTRPQRPAALVWACAVVWAACAGVMGILSLVAVAVLAMPDEIFDELERQQVSLQGATRDELIAAMLVVCVVGIVWAVVAIVLAALAFLRIGWARIALIACSALAAAAMLLLLVGGPVILVLVVPAVATCILLVRPDVTEWYRR